MLIKSEISEEFILYLSFLELQQLRSVLEERIQSNSSLAIQFLRTFSYGYEI